MAKATFIPAVTETKTIELVPAKVAIEVTPAEAAVLAALVGNTLVEGVTAYTNGAIKSLYELYTCIKSATNAAGQRVPHLQGHFEFNVQE